MATEGHVCRRSGGVPAGSTRPPASRGWLARHAQHVLGCCRQQSPAVPAMSACSVGSRGLQAQPRARAGAQGQGGTSPQRASTKCRPGRQPTREAVVRGGKAQEVGQGGQGGRDRARQVVLQAEGYGAHGCQPALRHRHTVGGCNIQDTPKPPSGFNFRGSESRACRPAKPRQHAPFVRAGSPPPRRASAGGCRQGRRRAGCPSAGGRPSRQGLRRPGSTAQTSGQRGRPGVCLTGRCRRPAAASPACPAGMGAGGRGEGRAEQKLERLQDAWHGCRSLA